MELIRTGKVLARLKVHYGNDCREHGEYNGVDRLKFVFLPLIENSNGKLKSPVK